MKAYQIINLVESFKDAKVKFTNEEDEHTVDVYIDTFKELSKRNIIKGSDKDIGKWIKAGWEEFRDFVDQAKENHSNRDVKKKRINKSNEVIVLVDNDYYTAVVPLTERSSCYYGKNTNWCVSVVSEENMFNAYVAAAKFPIHIMVGTEMYSIVYSFIKNGITEYRDSENKQLPVTAFDGTPVDISIIIDELMKHESKLMKLSEKSRLTDSKAAIFYALSVGHRFEEGEDLIAEEFRYCLYYLTQCVHFMYIPVIDKTLLSNMSEIDSYTENDRYSSHKIIEKYLREHYTNKELPVYADEDYIIENYPVFYIKHMTNMGEVLTEDTFEFLLEHYLTYQNKKNDDDDMISDFTGLDKVEPALNYIKFLYNKNQDIDEYLEILFDIITIDRSIIISYIVENGYQIGLSDKLLEGLKDEKFTFGDVSYIVRNAVDGEYIFTHIKPSQLSGKMLYKLIMQNKKVLEVIGEIPDHLKDYMEEEGLSLPQ